MKTLSVIIPAYNEAAYIEKLLEEILKVNIAELGFKYEIIVVDDCSRDDTSKIVQQFCERHNEVKLIKQLKNQGKGAAVQRGVKESTGEWFLVQDADLEYNPKDYIPMLKQLNNRNNVAIYGSRVLGEKQKGLNWINILGKHPQQKWGPWLAGRLLSLWTFFIYGQWITDTLTAYKLYPSQVVKSFQVKTNGFETDHELTAKLISSHIIIEEVPISYIPRTVEEGKKIKSSDFFIALWTLVRFKFAK